MKIAYFAFREEFPAPHAGYVHVNEITKNIAKLGIHLTLYVRPPKSDLSVDNKEDNRIIKYVKFPCTVHSYFKKDLIWLSSSYYKVKKEAKDYDLIHERFAILNIWPSFMLKDTGKPHILELNSPGPEEVSNKLFQIVAKRLREIQFKNIDAIITQTNTIRKILSNYTSKPIFVVPNGVDTTAFNPNRFSKELRERYARDNEILITFVGAFKAWHGIQDIPVIAKEILARHKNVKFLLVGGGNLFKEVSEKVKHLDNIILTGPQPYSEIPKYLLISDILIAPFNTGFEGLDRYGFWWNPVKLFEYMASGKPIVSFGFEEVRKIVRGAGLLAEVGNIDDFVEKLEYLIECESERRKMGMIGREIAVKEYDWKKRAEETIEIYKKVLSS